jgi:uncharacterized protein YkwD
LGFLEAGAAVASRRRSYRSIAIIGSAIALLVTLGFSSVAAATTTTGSGSSDAVATTTTSTTAPWLSVETYYLKLLNCTRTGGWVTSTGYCKGYGSGRYSAYRPPLPLSAFTSNNVARPYAKKLAVRNLCGHFYDGSPGYRLRRAGISWSTYGENMGCRPASSAYASVLGSHLFFQSEKSYNGGHWANIKNAKFTRVGIGFWRYSGRNRLVVDFYRPG